MTTIDTLDALRELPTGSTVRIGDGDEYRLTEGTGWRHCVNGAEHGPGINAEHFSGAISARMLTLYDPLLPVVGNWYRDPSYQDNNLLYLVTGEPTSEDPDTWPTLRFRGGEPGVRLLLSRTFRALEAITPEAAFGQAARMVLTLIAAAEEGRAHNATLTERVTELEEAHRNLANAPAVPQTLVEALHSWAGNADDNEFDEMLDRQNIGRTRTVGVTVDVRGEYRSPTSAAQDVTGLPNGWIDDPGTIEFSWSLTVAKEGTGCMCDSVTHDDVAAAMPEGHHLDLSDITWDTGGCTAD